MPTSKMNIFLQTYIIDYPLQGKMAKQLQTVKIVEDFQDSCRLSRPNSRQLWTVRTTSECYRTLHTCLFLSANLYGQSVWP